MIPESAEKVSLMEAGVNISAVPSRPTEKPQKFKKATISLISRLSSFKRKSEEPPFRKNRNFQNGSMTSVNVDGGYAQSIDEHLSDELSVKVCKDSIRFSLIEHMKTLGSNVNCLFDLEQNGEVFADNFNKKYPNLSTKEKNLVFLWTCFLRRDDLVERLYQEKADIFSTVPNEGFTSLHLAAFSGCVKTCKWLILNGLEVNLIVKKLSPLHCAVLGNSLECTKLLLRNGATIGSTVLHCAVEANATDCLQHLLRKNAAINAVDENGLTALHVAADRGMDKCLEIIVSHSPKEDLNIQTRWRLSTPLHLAAENGYFECVKLLLDGGADVKAANHKEQTALHLAAKIQSIECMEILLNAGCDVNAKDVDSKTPLHAALVSKSAAFSALEVLLKRGAKVNIRDKFGYTPLHLAALDELSQCVDCLIMHGGDVTARTDGGVSALSIIGRKTPGSINAICRKLDSSIYMTNRETSSKEVDLKFDFRYLLQNSSVGEVGFLKTLEEEGQKDLIEHPLCEAFLHLKWQKIRKFYFCRIILSFVFVVFFSFYLLSAVDLHDSPAEEKIMCENNYNISESNGTTGGNYSGITFHNCFIGNDSTTANYDIIISGKNLTTLIQEFNASLADRKHHADEEKNKTKLHEDKEQNKIWYMYWFLFFMAILKAVRKIISVLQHRSMKHYLYQPMNVFEWYVIISMTCVYPGQTLSWLKLLGSTAVLLAWTEFMVKIGGLPVFGAYVSMFTKILVEFFRLLFAYSCFLVGFTVSFCIVFSSETSFKNPLVGLVKIIAMMTGDVDPEILSNYYAKIDNDITTFLTALLIYTLFTLLVTIVLMNLLVGIAVRDIQGLEKTAGLSKLIQQTKLVYYLELAMCSSYVPKRIVQLLRQLALVSPGAFRMVLHVKPLHPREKRLPKEVLLAALKLAKQKQTWTNPASCWSDRRDSVNCIPNQDEKSAYEELRRYKEMVQAQNLLISKLMEGKQSHI